jgi:hypothetical protein
MRWIVPTAVLLTLALAGSAGAAPMANYVIDGGPEQPVRALLPGPNGSMMVVQELATGPFNEEHRYRFARVDAAGTTVASSTAQIGPIMGAATAADGGAWALTAYGNTPHLVHAAPDGSVREAMLPEHLRMSSLAAGPDGRVWSIGCRFSSGTGDVCSAIATDVAGTATEYPFPAGALDHPTNSGWGEDIYATDHGLWMTRTFIGHNGRAVFVTTAGVASIVALPAGAALAAPAAGDDAWWIQAHSGSATFGQVAPDGTTQALREHPIVENGLDVRADTGRARNLLWSQDRQDGFRNDGAVGTMTVADDRMFEVPAGFTSVPFSDEFWSGSCSFGYMLHETSDGAIWAVSSGHPDRISRWVPSTGAFTTFLPTDGAVSSEQRIWTMGEASDGFLWFAFMNPDGRQMLARANVDDPPAGLPPFPSGPVPTSPAPALSQKPAARTTKRAIAATLASLHGRLSGLRGRRHRATVAVTFAARGTLSASLTARDGRRSVPVARGTVTGRVGRLVLLTIRATPTGRALLRRHKRPAMTLTLRFRSADGVTGSRVRRVRI